MTGMGRIAAERLLRFAREDVGEFNICGETRAVAGWRGNPHATLSPSNVPSA